MDNSNSQNLPRVVFLQGKKVYLSPIETTDAPILQKWCNDREVTKFLRRIYPITLTEERKWTESIGQGNGGSITLGIVVAENHRLIGTISLGISDTGRLSGLATMGYMIGEKDCWSMGYGSDALELIVQYAFSTLNIRKISAGVFDFNPRSRKCLEKCGFTLEGTKIKHEFREGRYIDIHILTRFRE